MGQYLSECKLFFTVKHNTEVVYNCKQWEESLIKTESDNERLYAWQHP